MVGGYPCTQIDGKKVFWNLTHVSSVWRVAIDFSEMELPRLDQNNVARVKPLANAFDMEVDLAAFEIDEFDEMVHVLMEFIARGR